MEVREEEAIDVELCLKPKGYCLESMALDDCANCEVKVQWIRGFWTHNGTCYKTAPISVPCRLPTLVINGTMNLSFNSKLFLIFSPKNHTFFFPLD